MKANGLSDLDSAESNEFDEDDDDFYDEDDGDFDDVGGDGWTGDGDFSDEEYLIATDYNDYSGDHEFTHATRSKRKLRKKNKTSQEKDKTKKPKQTTPLADVQATYDAYVWDQSCLKKHFVCLNQYLNGFFFFCCLLTQYLNGFFFFVVY